MAKSSTSLIPAFDPSSDSIEIGVDEAGRGPLFGALYTAAVILPKDDSFNHSLMKDSKKFHSKKKINEAAQYIKDNALAWTVSFESEQIIDTINIRRSVLHSMHKSIAKNIKNYNNKENLVDNINFHLLIDGNDFNPFITFNKNHQVQIRHTCIESGDNKYSAIAAASILAKTERDKYIENLCQEHPSLITNYKIDTNKGYGTAAHINGIKTHGITDWHRKTYGICKEYTETN